MRSLVLFGLLAACYRPGADPACLTTCDPGETNACPGSLVCMSDGKCHDNDGSCGPGTDDDGGVDSSDANAGCYGVGPLKICLEGTAEPPRTFASTTIDTTNCTGMKVQQDDGPELCVLSGSTVTLDTVTVVGTRPLVVLATDTLVLTGIINAASEHADNLLRGPGSDPTGMCNGLVEVISNAGGAGGSFGGAGGRGGRVATLPTGVVNPTVLRGGCPGFAGMGTGTAAGGHGGGAIYFIAGSSISVNGVVNASGAGGSPSGTTGGGGGGSGGMIGFDAPMITVTGTVFANGGGGAGGAVTALGGFGGDPVNHNSAAMGGTGVTNANGGNGSLGGAGADGGTGTVYGGGGGGGTGVIRVYPASQQAAFVTRVSPAPSN